jgi:hypothetical protein
MDTRIEESFRREKTPFYKKKMYRKECVIKRLVCVISEK